MKNRVFISQAGVIMLATKSRKKIKLEFSGIVLNIEQDTFKYLCKTLTDMGPL